MGCGASAPAAFAAPAGPAATSKPFQKAQKTVISFEADGDGAQDVTIPSYWTNKKHVNRNTFGQMVYTGQADHAVFNRMLQQTYAPISTKDRPCPKKTDRCERQSQGCPCVRVEGTPGLPIGFCVRRVVRVESSQMWSRYTRKRDAIRANRDAEKTRQFDPPVLAGECVPEHPGVFEALDTSVNEAYLWHGTHVRTALSIAQNSFDIKFAGTGRGAMFGPGAYFAESCTKADEYAHDEPNGYYDGIHAMLLCRVCMGNMYYTTKFGQEDAYDKVKGGGFDSVLGDMAKYRKTFREFVVYDADQVYPEYVVLYSRVHKHDSEEQISMLAASPYHLELPVYWKNCHRRPKEEDFDEQCCLSRTSRDLLQRLLSACADKACGKFEVQAARRVENSKLSNQYVALKKRVQASIKDATEDEEGVAIAQVLTSKFLRAEGDFVEESISVDNLDLPLNEHLMWYGAMKEEVRMIAHNGLDVTRGSNNPDFARFGRGLYFSDAIDKSLEYAEKDDDGIQSILLCRVCCGKVLHTEESSLPDGEEMCFKAGKHSICAQPEPSRPREFVVLENAQVYPEFILEVKTEPIHFDLGTVSGGNVGPDSTSADAAKPPPTGTVAAKPGLGLDTFGGDNALGEGSTGAGALGSTPASTEPISAPGPSAPHEVAVSSEAASSVPEARLPLPEGTIPLEAPPLTTEK
eukprot:TRINITY_DN93138_c0_g1_i1.p1 TRINITY_DN93138_c0_g1~~TRINITY_DN93138_c0_g1_i1.p1  ORF type:complete len:690 (-),score=119.73 TRINITY_DN93138_c0_g1_i1:27-2096(-)